MLLKLNDLIRQIVICCFILFYLNINGQTSCEVLTQKIKTNGIHITTDRSFFDDAISKIEFYKEVLNSITIYYAIVTFNSNKNKSYTYQIPKQAMNDYLSWLGLFSKDSGKFWKYIQPYNKVLNCTPSKRQGNKFRRKY